MEWSPISIYCPVESGDDQWWSSLLIQLINLLVQSRLPLTSSNYPKRKRRCSSSQVGGDRGDQSSSGDAGDEFHLSGEPGSEKVWKHAWKMLESL